ncbi:MAG TPA: YchJ family metal-binding protein [Pseudobdellovibrionaceae bacterium]|nr:YchJ family metal-binding protein [Pseudobdellovibrionaceae bacterium]
MKSNECPCGSKKEFSQCCGPLIAGDAAATTPEQLMRSRYTAFVLQKMEYVRKTTDPQTFHLFDFPGNEKWAAECEFCGLEILRSSEDGNKGLVEFKAQFRPRVSQNSGDELQTHHELSQFRRQGGVWYFRNGKVQAEKQSSQKS